jgi:hypothetical protein
LIASEKEDTPHASSNEDTPHSSSNGACRSLPDDIRAAGVIELADLHSAPSTQQHPASAAQHGSMTDEHTGRSTVEFISVPNN